MRRHTDASFHGGTYNRASTITGLVAALALTLSACGTGAGNDTDTTEPVESTTTVTTAPDTTAPDEQGNTTNSPTADTTTAQENTEETTTEETNDPVGYLGDPDTDPEQNWPESVPGLMVSNVRVASHDGFDRVVFDLAGEGDPGWFTNYTAHPAQQGSGNPVPIEGSVALMVGIHGTPYPFDLDLDMEFPDHGTYPGAGNVTEVIYTSLFEARTEFVIGLTEELPYSVTVLEEPKRLVIDFVAQ